MNIEASNEEKRHDNRTSELLHLVVRHSAFVLRHFFSTVM
jgi:hypothetical protein